MSKISKSIKREEKRFRKKNGMRETGRSNLLIQRIQVEKAEKIRREQERKEKENLAYLSFVEMV